MNEKIRKKKFNNGLIVFLIVLVVGVIIAILFASVTGTFSKGSGNYYSDYGYDTGKSHLSVIEITGTIENVASPIVDTSSYNQKWLLNMIDSLSYDYENQGIILYLNTPGGSVYATDEVYLKLLEYKVLTGKPVYASMGPMCASGGYYIACAADKIYANRNSLTGSIGVTMGTLVDISQLLEKYGINTTTLISRKNKAMGSMYNPVTDEQKAIYQSIIDESYEQFAGIVAKSRKMPLESVKEIADGRIYTAKQATDNGLIDGIMTLDETISQFFLNNGDFGDTCPVYTYRYTPRVSVFSMLQKFTQSMTSTQPEKGDLATALEMAENSSPQPYYLAQ